MDKPVMSISAKGRQQKRLHKMTAKKLHFDEFDAVLSVDQCTLKFA
jgi:hypothetical protein